MFQIRWLAVSHNVVPRGMNKLLPRWRPLSLLPQNTSQSLLVNHYSRSSRSSKKISTSIAFARSIWNGTSRRDANIPELVYLQSPWKYLKVKMSLLWFKLFWDPSFKAEDFMLGAKQATIVLTNLLMDQNFGEIRKLTSEDGFKQIQQDMTKSQGDPRIAMLKFRVKDIKEAIPVRTYFTYIDGQKHCTIDMFFVGMRNIEDFEQSEQLEMEEFVRNYDSLDWQTEDEIIPGSNAMKKLAKQRVVFAEILVRFHQEYVFGEEDEWSVAFYKIASFDVLAF